MPDMVMNFVVTHHLSPWSVMALIMGLMMIMGMFLESVSILMITVPIFYPLIIQLGFDGIWFGVMITINMELALITPPVGLNDFVIQGIAKAPLSDVIRGVMPFALIMLVGMAIFAAFPILSTWLPNVLITR
jgi:C4-dicarboxylate transporter DctM subunit